MKANLINKAINRVRRKKCIVRRSEERKKGHGLEREKETEVRKKDRNGGGGGGREDGRKI